MRIGCKPAFAATGIGFAIDGAPRAEDPALLDAGLDLAVSDRLSVGVSYQGQYADTVSDNAVKGRLTWLFNKRQTATGGLGNFSETAKLKWHPKLPRARDLNGAHGQSVP
ncbi:MAG: hypothetical protein QNJ62_12550 [Methyloceanibacter sp.]|nr:hypothetical protein [Methyloceanibacter sp.]